MEDKALQMGKSSTVGSFFLLIGVVGSNVILALGTLILAGLLSDSELGLYSIVLIPSNIIAYFRDLGVNSAITQKIASLRAENKTDEIHDIVLSGIVFELVSGALLALACFAIAQPIAMILNRPDASPLIALMSISIFASAVVSAGSAIFVGFEKMKLNSFTQILQALIKTLLGPLMVFLGFSVLGAVLGAVVSVVVGGIISIGLVYFALFRPLRKSKVGACNIKRTLTPMLKYGVPLTLSNIVVGVLPQIFAFFMALYVSNSMMGNYTAAMYFAILVTFISFPISTALFPAFSKLNPEKEPELVKTVFASSVKYTALVLIPTTMLIITLSTPIVNTLFPQAGILSYLQNGLSGIKDFLFGVDIAPKFPYAPIFLALSSIVNLLVLFGHVSLSAFQTGIGKTKQMMKQSILSLAISLPFSYVIITYFGTFFSGAESEMFVIIGGILSVMVSTIPGMVWGLIWSWKKYRIKADFKNSAKIFTSSLIASIVAYVFVTVINASYPILLLTGALLFLVVYLIVTPLIGAINRVDIDNLKQMSSELGIISKIIKILLTFMQKFSKKNPEQNTFDIK
ncbi:MAG: oligosaccharide flippase family protein [Candidatus Bathyarchaeota archaeon]|nr:oligosaccharide flippase family protein [Candidatus Termiticorpusculum sp.]